MVRLSTMRTTVGLRFLYGYMNYNYLVSQIQLILHKIIICPSLGGQRLMVANLNHLTLVKDYDLVGILHRAQAMSNYHNRLALIELIQVLHDITLVVGI